MNDYRDGDELGGLRHAVDGTSPDVDGLVAGGLSRGRQLAKRAATRKRMVTFGGPALAAAAVVGVLLTGALSGGNGGAATGVAASGGSVSSSATPSQPSPKTKSVTPPLTTAKSVTSASVTPAATTRSVTPPPPTRSLTKDPTTVAAQPNAPIDTQGLPSPSTPAALGAVGALQDLLPAGGAVVNPRVFPKDALTLAATYTRAGQSAQMTVAVFTAHQAGGPAVCVSGSNCVVTSLPNGPRQLVTTYSNQHWDVTIYRTDGTLLTVSAVQAGDAGMPLTKAQLIELARSDRWTHLGN